MRAEYPSSLPVSSQPGEPDSSNDVVCEEDFFDEEPVTLKVEDGYGYAPVNIGDVLGPNGRFQILRKLGWGGYATVWMVKDREKGRVLALKILTDYATRLVYGQVKIPGHPILDEPRILRRISHPTSSPGAEHCIQLIGEFIISRHSVRYQCLLTEVAGLSLEEIQDMVVAEKGFAGKLSKLFVWQLCLALQYLHDECRVVHTDIKPNNILLAFDQPLRDELINIHLESRPPKKYPIRRIDGVDMETIVSQPLPVPGYSTLHVPQYTFQLSDFGPAQFLDQKRTDRMQPLQLRAPEIILGLPWDAKVDIWSLGCLACLNARRCTGLIHIHGQQTFETLVSRKLFPIPVDLQWPDDEYMLAKYLEIHNLDRVPQHMCEGAQNVVNRDGSYLAPILYPTALFTVPYVAIDTGTLRHIPSNMLHPTSVRERLLQHQVFIVTDEGGTELDLAISFIERCLVLDKNDRASASELLKLPWLEGVPEIRDKLVGRC
ncbi:kinase-like domain-containing protein [Sparassis latifolia]